MPPKLCNWPAHPVFAASASTKGKAKPAKTAEAGGKAKLGTLPEWNLADLYHGAGFAEAQGRPRNLRARRRRHAGALCRQARRAARRRQGRRGARASRARVRGAERHAWAASSPMRACSTPPTPRTPSGRNSSATSRRRSPRSPPSCCSSRSSSTGSTTRCSRRRWPSPSSAITGPGSRTCARRSPISSRTSSSSCSTRRR